MANAKVINRMVNLTSFVETAKVPTADDIMTGKEAWANGAKIVGEGSGGGGGDDYGYKRVSGVPDIEAIINAAEPINYGGVTDTRYVSDLQAGLVFLLSEDCPTLTVDVRIDGVLLPQDGNYQVHSGTPDYVVFVSGKQPTGAQVTTIEYNYTTYSPMFIWAEYSNKLSTNPSPSITTDSPTAYIFSDAPTVLEVGNGNTHTWDATKDFLTVEGWGCRWVMAYGTGTAITAARFSYGATSDMAKGAFELVLGSYTYASNASISWGYTSTAGTRLKYFKALSGCVLPYRHVQGFLSGQRYLQTVIINGRRNSTSSTNSSYFLADCPSLEKLYISDNYIGTLGSQAFNTTYYFSSLKEYYSGGLTNGYAFNGYNYNLFYHELNPTDESSNFSMLTFCTYIKLYTNFNRSGCNFTGSVTKSIKWFYDLAGWLADRSGDTAGTIILGAENIAILNSLYLEDGITPLTSIYDAKNWTRS